MRSKEMKQVISLGLGVQSTALYLMSSMGELPSADVAVFSDTGRESEGTYTYLRFLLDWKRKYNGIPLIVLKQKNLYKDLLNCKNKQRFVSIPAFTKNKDNTVGMLRRQCTSDYKIVLINNYIRDYIYKLPKGSRRPVTEVWLGITTDEINRISNPCEAWKINAYPFLGYGIRKDGSKNPFERYRRMSRNEVTNWYHANNLPVPPKSSCVFCPFQSDHAWAMHKLNRPADFAAAVAVDNAIRNSSAKGAKRPLYLHKSCKPLSEVEFDINQEESWGECTGNCHI